MNSPKTTLTALIVASAFAAPVAFADCHAPPTPSKIPNGATANQQQMLTAMQTIKEYEHDVKTYLKCLNFQVRQNRMSTDDQVTLHNAAISQLRQIASKFNHQVHVFKSKHS